MLKTGQVVVFEQGEYSDFSYYGPFRVLKDFSIGRASEEWCGQRPPVDLYEIDLQDFDQENSIPKSEDGERPFFFITDLSSFVSWLNNTGYIEDLDNVETVDLGSYGRLEYNGDHL